MEATVKKWGNSLAIRLPKYLADQINISEGTAVELFANHEKISIKPLKKKSYKLDELLSKVDKNSSNEEIDWGQTEGNEVW